MYGWCGYRIHNILYKNWTSLIRIFSLDFLIQKLGIDYNQLLFLSTAFHGELFYSFEFHVPFFYYCVFAYLLFLFRRNNFSLIMRSFWFLLILFCHTVFIFFYFRILYLWLLLFSFYFSFFICFLMLFAYNPDNIWYSFHYTHYKVTGNPKEVGKHVGEEEKLQNRLE